jgi:hypothetical protein
LVGALLFSCCPTNVVWFVIAVVVYPIDRHPKRTIANVGKESSKVMPAFADTNPAAAIISEVGTVAIIATLAHAFPYTVQRVTFSPCMPMSSALPTTTRLLPLAKMTPANEAQSAAITAALPYLLAAAIGSNRHDSHEVTKALPGNILEVTHDGLRERQLWRVAGLAQQRYPAAYSAELREG